MSHWSLRLIAVPALLAMLVTGCDHDKPDPPEPGPSPVTSPVPGRSPVTFSVPTTRATSAPARAPGCPLEFRIGLPVQTKVKAEVPYLNDIVACTNDAQDMTYLVNNSDVAWTFRSSVAQLTNTPKARSYREVAGLAGKVAAASVFAPDSAVRVDAAPSTVEWTLAPGLSVTWLAHEWFVDAVSERGSDQLTEMLSVGGSPRRRALITCGVQAYQIAGDAAGSLSGPDPTKQLFSRLGVEGLGIAGSGAECAKAWKQADVDAQARFRATATWDVDIARLSRNATLLNTADNILAGLRRVGQAILLVRG